MISFVFGGANTASGAQVAVRLIEVEGANVQRSDIDVLRSLLESDLIEHPDVRLLSDDDPTPAEMDISAKITRLGNSYLVILTAQFSNGEQRSRKHKLADFDEIDIATRRLVAALIEDIDFFATVSRGEVLEVDSSPETLVKATRGFEVGFGPAWPISDALHDNGTMYGFHAAIVWDIRDVLIDLRTDFQFGEDHVNTFAFTATVGGRYVWYDARRYALYSGAELGYGYVVVDDPGPNPDRHAFAVGANSGILFLRHSDINIDLRLRIVTLTRKLQGKLPVLLGISLGLRF